VCAAIRGWGVVARSPGACHVEHHPAAVPTGLDEPSSAGGRLVSGSVLRTHPQLVRLPTRRWFGWCETNRLDPLWLYSHASRSAIAGRLSTFRSRPDLVPPALRAKSVHISRPGRRPAEVHSRVAPSCASCAASRARTRSDSDSQTFVQQAGQAWRLESVASSVIGAPVREKRGSEEPWPPQPRLSATTRHGPQAASRLRRSHFETRSSR